jgi:3-isopropylmalate/(R)-2-methylmalate dehydratase small subunit
MTPLRTIDAVAVPLDESNVDTDQLAPGRFLMRSVSPELLLHDRRFDAQGKPHVGFVLNDPAYAGAQIIVARRNFGIGSSREAAALALPTAGFRCVIAMSFGDIFYGNCLRNGVLPIVLDETTVGALLQALRARPGMHLVVDLPSQTVAGEGLGPFAFAISPARKQCLLEGLDDAALTDRYRDAIAAFEANYYRAFPWLA